VSITIEAEPMAIEVDALSLAGDLSEALTQHYVSSLLSGMRPDRGPLPLNAQGKPYGLGSGTIAKQWGRSPAQGTKTLAQASSWPFQEGGYIDAVIYLEGQGSSLVSTEGKAGELIDMVVSAHADRMVKG
jgi:hypothetical protein